MPDNETTASSHHSNQRIFTGRPFLDSQVNSLVKQVEESLRAELNALREYVDQRLKEAELNALRENVDQRLKEINQRIDVLHSHVRGVKHGPAVYTDVTIENWSNEHLTLYDQHHWYGSANVPVIIPPQMSQKIKHDADSHIGDSKGGVAFTIRNNIRWVVAWSNMKDTENKVYIDVIETDDEIDWNVYQSLLDTSTSKPNPVNKYRSRVMANIDPSSATPLLNAKLNPAIR